MPEYTPTNWENETPISSPVKYRIVDDVLGEVVSSGTIEIITSVTAGTPLNSTLLNHIEQGIKDAQDTANEQVVTDKLVDGILSADAAGRAKMADGFLTLLKLSSDLRFQKLFEFIADGTSQPDWLNIPQTFLHLIVISTGISTRTSAGWDGFNLRVNGDSGATNYHTYTTYDDGDEWRWNYGITNPNAEGFYAGVLPAQGIDQFAPGSSFSIIPDYRGTAFYKQCINLSFFHGNYGYGKILVSTRRNVVDPITRLTGFMSSGYYPRAGSVFSLYGFN